MASYAELKPTITNLLDSLPNGQSFNLRDLLGNQWPEARKLGTDFRDDLADYVDIIDQGKDSANLRWYRKN